MLPVHVCHEGVALERNENGTTHQHGCNVCASCDTIVDMEESDEYKNRVAKKDAMTLTIAIRIASRALRV